jgi:hypothetical protein
MSELGGLTYPRYTVAPRGTDVPAEGRVSMTGGFTRRGLDDIGRPGDVMRRGYGLRPAHATAVAAVSIFWPTTLGTTTVCGFVGVRDAVDAGPDDDPPQAASAGMSRTVAKPRHLNLDNSTIDAPSAGSPNLIPHVEPRTSDRQGGGVHMGRPATSPRAGDPGRKPRSRPDGRLFGVR